MIPKMNKILYATDLSKNSSYAFLYAIDMAKRHDAKIILLHAMEPIPAYADIYMGGMKEKQKQREAMIENIKGHLQAFCKKAETQVGFPCVELITKVVVSSGHPVEEILEAADKEGCDAIVLGTHGKGFLAQTFLGSVASSVLHRTRKPVFIIPLPSEKITLDWDGV
ncbi:MAG: hypothetical protein A2169_00570 [Deltaproteobacteria bacterium RBG_13_47_9]|nr:MAG: hypothetical protein A2169_00570 [Deltaproteobacteria bacterium RBG_13_47_9]